MSSDQFWCPDCKTLYREQCTCVYTQCAICEKPVRSSVEPFVCSEKCYSIHIKVVRPLQNQLTTLTEEKVELIRQLDLANELIESLRGSGVLQGYEDSLVDKYYSDLTPPQQNTENKS